MCSMYYTAHDVMRMGCSTIMFLVHTQEVKEKKDAELLVLPTDDALFTDTGFKYVPGGFAVGCFI